MTSMTENLEPIFVSLDEGARFIGIRRSKFYELVRAGEIKIVKLGRKSLVEVAALRAYGNKLSAA